MRCIIVKGGQRCSNDSTSSVYDHQHGIVLPILVPDKPPLYICGDCIYSLYQQLVAGDFKQAATNMDPSKVRQEFR